MVIQVPPPPHNILDLRVAHLVRAGSLACQVVVRHYASIALLGTTPIQADSTDRYMLLRQTRHVLIVRRVEDQSRVQLIVQLVRLGNIAPEAVHASLAHLASFPRKNRLNALLCHPVQPTAIVREHRSHHVHLTQCQASAPVVT